MLDEQHGRPPVGVQLGEVPHEIGGDERGEPEGELVDDEQVGLGHEGTTHRDHLLLPAREGVRPLAPHPAEVGEQVVHGVGVAAPSPPRPEAQVVVDAQVAEHLPPLGDLGDGAVDPHGARCRTHEPADGIHERRLARAVRTHEGDQLARTDVQRHPVERRRRSVADDQVGHVQHHAAVSLPR
ncbi:hypothetical protein SRABI128_02555 [Microbacterium sp. Bi128]|nr:hypothetical protein SRABI128_02555 [Microbacterium sp. Bi128]